MQIKEAVHLAKSSSATALTPQQQNDFFASYNKILMQAEQIIRGSPKRRNVHLSTHNLYRRFSISKEAILRFMTDFRVPFVSVGSERDLRMLKLQQKISCCFRSAAGARVFCRVRSFLSSARKEEARSLQTALESALMGQPIVLPTR